MSEKTRSGFAPAGLTSSATLASARTEDAATTGAEARGLPRCANGKAGQERVRKQRASPNADGTGIDPGIRHDQRSGALPPRTRP